MKIIFFGTPDFAAQTLLFLIQNQVDVAAVVSKPDRPKGRSGYPIPTPVKMAAQSHQLPLYQPEIVSEISFSPILESHDADLFVVVAYGEIIKPHLLQMPRLACINLHTSLLPKYRGAAPIQQAIIHGEVESGISIMHMVKKMDAGDIIKQIKVPIPPEMTFGEVEEELLEKGCQVLLVVINSFAKAEPIRVAQNETLVSFAPKIELEDCRMDWRRPAQELHDLVRGVNPYPGAWCDLLFKGERKKLKIYRTRLVFSGNCEWGTHLNPEKSKENMIIGTGDQALELLEIQLEGKKRLSSAEFFRGIHPNQIQWKNFLL